MVLQDPKNVVLIGEGYFEKLEDELKGPHVFIDKVTKRELKKLQQDITQTNRPEYIQGPPVNLGSPGHGKLKAISGELVSSLTYPFQLHNFGRRRPVRLNRTQKLLSVATNFSKASCTLLSPCAGQHPTRHQNITQKNSKKTWWLTWNVCWTSTLIFSFAQITILPSTLDPSSHNSDQHMVGGCFLLKELSGSCNESIQTANWVSNGSRQDMKKLLTKLHRRTRNNDAEDILRWRKS